MVCHGASGRIPPCFAWFVVRALPKEKHDWCDGAAGGCVVLVGLWCVCLFCGCVMCVVLVDGCIATVVLAGGLVRLVGVVGVWERRVLG